MLFVVLGQRMAELNNEKKIETIEAYQQRIYDEVEIALSVENGYLRRFQIPKTILNSEINLSVEDDGSLTLYYGGKKYSKFLPQPMVGGFCFNDTGLNFFNLTVSKDADLVSLSSCVDCRYSYAVCNNAEDNGWCDWLSSPGLFPGFNETCCSDHCLCC